MNTTWLSRFVAAVFAGGALVSSVAVAQERGPAFRIGIDAGIGYARKIGASTSLVSGDYSPGGLASTVRLRWGTHRLFGAGLETGWLPISSLEADGASTSLGTTDIDATLRAIPFLFVASLQGTRLYAHAGLGYYRVEARSTVFGSTAESHEWDFGYIAAVGYALPWTSSSSASLELEWNSITELRVSVISLQVRARLRLWETGGDGPSEHP